MYVGHVGAALGAKRIAPSVGLSALVVAAYLPDWVDAGLCVTGKYHDAQMLSHSVPAVLVLALLAAFIAMRHRDWQVALVVAGVVISHVLLDYLTGIKPTWAGGPFIGFQIYRYPLIDFPLEGGVVLAGWLLYRKTIPPSPSRWRSPGSMLFVLLMMQALVDSHRLLFPAINKC